MDATGGKSVDDIWRELSARAAPVYRGPKAFFLKRGATAAAAAAAVAAAVTAVVTVAVAPSRR